MSAVITAAVTLWASRAGIPRGEGLSFIFPMLFATQDYPAAVCALVILIVGAFFPEQIRARNILEWVGQRPLQIALATVVVLSAGTLIVYQNHPLSQDEYAAYFQSRIFAAGHLAGRFPPELKDWLIARGIQGQFLSMSTATGRVVSTYWPSYALLLTPFTALGVPWLCNPLICGATILAIHRLAFAIFQSVEGAGAALLLTIASPVFFADGISYYSMSAHLLANTVYALLLLEPSPRRAFLAGIVGSIALTLHNPVPHILFAVPWLLWVVSRRNLKIVACVLAGYLPLCLLLGVGWFFFASGIGHEEASAASKLSPFALPTWPLLGARFMGIAKIWVWSVPGLMLLAVVGLWKWRHNVLLKLLAASAALTLAGYYFVPFDQGHGWGYRYFHSAWMALPLLGAAALLPCPLENSHDQSSRVAVKTLVVAYALLSLFAGVGLRAQQIHRFVSEDLAQVPNHPSDEPRVIFLNLGEAMYEVDLVQNDPWLRDRTLRMISHGSKMNAVMMAVEFPDMHRIWADRFGEIWARNIEFNP